MAHVIYQHSVSDRALHVVLQRIADYFGSTVTVHSGDRIRAERREHDKPAPPRARGRFPRRGTFGRRRFRHAEKSCLHFFRFPSRLRSHSPRALYRDRRRAHSYRPRERQRDGRIADRRAHTGHRKSLHRADRPHRKRQTARPGQTARRGTGSSRASNRASALAAQTKPPTPAPCSISSTARITACTRPARTSKIGGRSSRTASFGPKTLAAIEGFQRSVMARKNPDGRIDPDQATMKALNELTKGRGRHRPRADDLHQHKPKATSHGASNISTAGLELIKRFEAFRAQPYNDQSGHCTVGYGHSPAFRSLHRSRRGSHGGDRESHAEQRRRRRGEGRERPRESPADAEPIRCIDQLHLQSRTTESRQLHAPARTRPGPLR